jgi:predicted phage-related endonuclease
LNEASKNLDYHTNDLLKVGADIKRQIARVEEFRTRIESEILESFEEKIIIKIDELGLEPLLALCESL